MHQEKILHPFSASDYTNPAPTAGRKQHLPEKNIKESMPPADCNKLELFRHLIQLVGSFGPNCVRNKI
jgi:hypothetical protein